VERLDGRRHDHARQNAHGGICLWHAGGHQHQAGDAVESVGQPRASRAQEAPAAARVLRSEEGSSRPRSAAIPAARYVIPAALCGTVGLENDGRRVSNHGVLMLSDTLDTLGPPGLATSRMPRCCSTRCTVRMTETRGRFRMHARARWLI
jgi:hypothetical protein